MIELCGDELKIRFKACSHGLNQLSGLEPMRVLRGDTQYIRIDRAVFFSR